MLVDLLLNSDILLQALSPWAAEDDGRHFLELVALGGPLRTEGVAVRRPTWIFFNHHQHRWIVNLQAFHNIVFGGVRPNFLTLNLTCEELSSPLFLATIVGAFTFKREMLGQCPFGLPRRSRRKTLLNSQVLFQTMSGGRKLFWNAILHSDKTSASKLAILLPACFQQHQKVLGFFFRSLQRSII